MGVRENRAVSYSGAQHTSTIATSWSTRGVPLCRDDFAPVLMKFIGGLDEKIIVGQVGGPFPDTPIEVVYTSRPLY